MADRTWPIQKIQLQSVCMLASLETQLVGARVGWSLASLLSFQPSVSSWNASLRGPAIRLHSWSCRLQHLLWHRNPGSNLGTNFRGGCRLELIPVGQRAAWEDRRKGASQSSNLWEHC